MADERMDDEKTGANNGTNDMEDNNGEEEEREEEEEPDHPVDRGWAWVILGSCWFIAFVVIGIAKSYGIFFIEFLKTFKASVSATTLITTLQTIAYCGASVPILAIYIKRYNTRHLAILASFGCALSYGLSSLADSITHLYFTHLLFGVMSAAINGPNLVILGKYFKKRRGLAMGLVASGNSLGGFLLPYLFRYLFDEYGLRGALLITAGLSLQCVVAACLLRPTEFYRKRKACKPRKISTSDNDRLEQQEKLLGDKHRTENVDNTNISLSHPVLPTDATATAKANYRVRSISHSPGYLNSSPSAKETESTSVLSLSSFSRYLSNGDIVSLSLQDIDIMRMNSKQEQHIDNKEEPVEGCWRICQYLTERDIFNFNIFRNKYFIAFLPAYSFGSLAPAFSHIFLPAFSREFGINDQNVATIASILSLSDFCGRLVAGLLADLPWIRKTYLVAITQFIIGIMMTISPMFNTFYLLVVFSIIYGLVGGFLFTLFSPIVIELVGLENFPNGMLVILILQGFWIGGNASFLGYLRDLTGSYNVTLQFMGASSFAAAVIFTTVEVIRKLTSSKDQKNPA
ncbi:monocarboxylate transporter 9-like [Pecten maximus]|uniref:monocarboxylate transporter 9-like n=1 Tax=Pecten maximus TaxID=6579 RepID=UPI0014587827|nr:monocarboxylate transporter 9-like [Pecten maximus]XP_033761110.1 monocarboxylate transporter 9-like [Pecten maximus]